MVKIASLVKTFATGAGELRAIDGVDLDLEGGSATALTGASGSGKSTMLHLIGGLDAPTSGSITVGEFDLTRMRKGALAAYRRQVGFVFQRYHLLPALTALDNVLTPVLPVRTTWDKRARGRELLALVGLEGRERDHPSKLSGGQQQRVAIARALINQPRLILADEPTGNLDSATSVGIIDLLLKLRAERGTTLILATHDLALASRCDRVARLRDGRVVEDHRLQPGEAAETLDHIARLG